MKASFDYASSYWVGHAKNCCNRFDLVYSHVFLRHTKCLLPLRYLKVCFVRRIRQRGSRERHLSWCAVSDHWPYIASLALFTYSLPTCCMAAAIYSTLVIDSAAKQHSYVLVHHLDADAASTTRTGMCRLSVISSILVYSTDVLRCCSFHAGCAYWSTLSNLLRIHLIIIATRYPRSGV